MGRGEQRRISAASFAVINGVRCAAIRSTTRSAIASANKRTISSNRPMLDCMKLFTLRRRRFLIQPPVEQPFYRRGACGETVFESEVIDALQEVRFNDEVQDGFICSHTTILTETTTIDNTKESAYSYIGCIADTTIRRRNMQKRTKHTPAPEPEAITPTPAPKPKTEPAEVPDWVNDTPRDIDYDLQM